ncbi:putative rhizopine catabolism regulatory protein MocR [Candidatus Terasakiella magnetica]|nr:putative rhizopine catabolism regulatory protein MocR [Candidatus Terasakiella magnetica]
MPRAADLPLTLTPLTSEDAAMPLHRRLYFILRAAIFDGRLTVGARLPSSRAMAHQMGISRNTVLTALDQLMAEGFIESRQGSGTRVVARPLPPSLAAREAIPQSPLQGRAISRRARELAELESPFGRASLLPLAPGLPDLDAFPHREWSRLLARRWRRPSRNLMVPQDAAGHPDLRAAIAEHLGRTRAVRCTPDQIILVAGSQQGLDLTARVLLDPGDQAMIEDPCYGGLKGALHAAGAQPVPVRVDDGGFDPELAQRLWPEARLACVTPSHQFPSGGTMPLERRLALIDWANRRGGWIVEDDYDSDFRYAGAPLAALQGLDSGNRTIYCGTFSKSMFPSLRLGWLVVPEDLLPAFLAVRRMADVAPSALTQSAMADFMAEGLFAAHLRRMRSLYAERRLILLQAAGRHLKGLLEVTSGDAGTHAIGWLVPEADDRVAASAAEAHGLAPSPLSRYRMNPGSPGLIIGYGNTASTMIETAILTLARALR